MSKSNLIDTNITTSTKKGSKSFFCPVEHCGKRIHGIPRQIAGHIKKCHPTVSSKLGLAKTSSKLAFICKHCNSYTSKVHYHCFECEHPENGCGSRYFFSAKKRDEHLKLEHAKWWFEYNCSFGKNCRGKKGGCGFNHYTFEHPYITDTADIPVNVCRYDRPWDGKRCLRDRCMFAHFWGRVRFLIKSRANPDEGETIVSDFDCAYVHDFHYDLSEYYYNSDEDEYNLLEDDDSFCLECDSSCEEKRMFRDCDSTVEGISDCFAHTRNNGDEVDLNRLTTV
jgi:hypothetical protein